MMSDITFSFVLSHKPNKVFKYLKALGRKIEEAYPGVYYISGDISAMQIIISQNITGVEKFWLGSLRDNLTSAEMTDLVKMARDQKQLKLKERFFDIVFKRNADTFKEVLALEYKELRDIHEEVGRSDKHIKKGMFKVALNMLIAGYSLDVISMCTEIPVEKIQDQLVLLFKCYFRKHININI
jgi:hypothetical protein